MAVVFKQTGKFIRHQKELLQVVSCDEQMIVDTFLKLKMGNSVDFKEMSEILFQWSQKWIRETT